MIVVVVLLVSCIHGNGGQWQHVVTKVKMSDKFPKVLLGVDLSALSAPVRVDWTVQALHISRR